MRSKPDSMWTVTRRMRTGLMGTFLRRPSIIAFGVLALVPLLAVAGAEKSEVEETPVAAPYPVLVTAETRKDPALLAALERKGKLLFSDEFESPDSLKNYFEISGLDNGRAKLVLEEKLAHGSRGAMQFTAPANGGIESGSGANYWFGPEGYEQVYFR